DQLQAVNEHRLLQLVRHAKLVATVALLQLVAAYAYVLVGVGRVVAARLFEVAHLAAAHEVRDELETRTVPSVEIRARRRLSIQLRDLERARLDARGHLRAARRRRTRLGLHDARRPDDAHGVRRLATAQSEDKIGGRGRRRGGVGLKLLP